MQNAVSNHALKPAVQWSKWSFLPLIRRFNQLQKDFPGNKIVLAKFYKKEQAALPNTRTTTDRSTPAAIKPRNAGQSAQVIASLASSIRSLSMGPETIAVKDKPSPEVRRGDAAANKKGSKRKAAGELEATKKRQKPGVEFDAAEFGQPSQRAARERMRAEIEPGQYWVPRCEYCITHNFACHVKRQVRQGPTPVCYECAARKSTCSLTAHSKKSEKSDKCGQSNNDDEYNESISSKQYT